MEQDTVVAACASTAIWMSTNTLAQRYRLVEFTTSQITQFANQYVLHNRAMPSDGLAPEQMLHALRTMGYTPLLIGLSDANRSKHLIYSYVESKIPVILLMQLSTGGDHSIVAISHGYQAPVNDPELIEVTWPGEIPLSFARSSEWVPNFLVNDDQRGPYRRLRFLQPDPNKLRAQLKSCSNPLTDAEIANLGIEAWKCPVAVDMNMDAVSYPGGDVVGNLWGAIVPLPQGVSLTCDQAERKAARLIRFRLWQTSIDPPDGMVLRTFLISSNEYKHRVEQTDMDIFVKLLYRSKPMPRWIWVTEISSVDSYNSTSQSRLLINGEVIIDSTSNQWTEDFVAFHYIDQSMMSVVATMQTEHQHAEEALTSMWVARRRNSYQGVIN
jgi:hypothetical protein